MLSGLAMSDSDTRQQAKLILDRLAFTPFDRCQFLSRDFVDVPARPGLYAFRHRDLGLLYIGKSKSLRDRLRGGHKAFLWSWLDEYDHRQVRIATFVLGFSANPALSYELETLILQATKPPYNVKIPRDET
jgi:excinuclease UvrABC nuclease subunit